MRTLSLVLALSLLAPLAGCLVRTGPPGRTEYRERGCPGGFHMDDGRCVKNGRGHDRDDDDHHGKGDDHRH